MEVSGHVHDPAALPQGNSPGYPFYKMLSGHYGEKKNLFPDPRFPGRPAHSQVAVLTELPRHV
jgi:hypothetical protein